MFSKTIIAAVFAAVVAAQQNPTFAPSSGEVVPACKPYTLKWNAVSAGPVDIVIISGATQGGQHVVGTVASGIANTGSFTYTFPAALGANAFSGYQIYKSGTTEFTYSEPFKVDAASCEEKPTSTPEAPMPSATEASYPTESSMSVETSTPAASETPVVPVSSSSICTTTSTVYVSAPAPSGTAPAGSPVPYPSAPAGSAAPYPTAPAGTAAPPAGTGAPLPSGTGAVPYPSAPPEFTGAAASVKAGLGLSAAAAAFILML